MVFQVCGIPYKVFEKHDLGDSFEIMLYKLHNICRMLVDNFVVFSTNDVRKSVERVRTVDLRIQTYMQAALCNVFPRHTT